MSDYNSLKAAINANIRKNGRQEITGQVLNGILRAMVDALGAGFTFRAVASPDTDPGSTDSRVFYVATTPGAYEHMGGIEIEEGEVAVLKFYDNIWHKEPTGLASQAALESLGDTLGAAIGEKMTFCELWCDGDKITRKDSQIALTFAEVKELMDDPSQFVALKYIDVFWMLPQYDDEGGAIIFTGVSLMSAQGDLWRVAINEENQISDYSIAIENQYLKTNDLGEEQRDNFKTYPTTQAVNAALDDKVDKVPGKGLSANDFTTQEKNKLAGLNNYDDTELRSQVQSGVTAASGSAAQAAASAASAESKYAGILQTMENLPDGSAVSAQVALNTQKVTELEGKVDGYDEILGATIKKFIFSTKGNGYLNTGCVLTANANCSTSDALKVSKGDKVIMFSQGVSLACIAFSADGSTYVAKAIGDNSSDYAKKEYVAESDGYVKVSSRTVAIDYYSPIAVNSKLGRIESEVSTEVDGLTVAVKKAGYAIYPAGNQTTSSKCDIYDIDNAGYSTIKVKVGGGSTSFLSLAFYSENPRSQASFMSGVTMTNAQTREISIAIPEGCKVIAVVNRKDYLAVPTIVLENSLSNAVAKNTDDIKTLSADVAELKEKETTNFQYEGEPVEIVPKAKREVLGTMKGLFGTPTTAISAQGFAIVDNRYFVQGSSASSDASASLVICDYNEKRIVSQLLIPHSNAHCNNITIGSRLSPSDVMPLLYVSNNIVNYECEVIKVADDLLSYEVKQTINYVGTNWLKAQTHSYDYVVDGDYLWIVGRAVSGVNRWDFVKFALPSLSVENVSLTDEDVVDAFTLDYYVMQGVTAINGKLFATYGYSSGGLYVIDPTRKAIVTSIKPYNSECEGLGVLNDSIVIVIAGTNPTYVKLTF